MRLLAVAAALLASAVAHGAQPDVVSTVPARNTMAPATTAISITFDEPLLTSSITSSSFRVFGRASGTASGTIAFSNGNATLTLTPSHPFSAGERVLINLSHDVRAADSTPLRSAGYAFEFTVRSAPAGMNFETIDVMSNRTGGSGGPQTRIYGALQADLDRDGWIDLATVNEVSADVRVFMNRADGSGLYEPFLAPVGIGVESSPNEPGDFDNDGKMDIAVSATQSGGVWIALGNGDGTFKTPQAVLTGDQPHGVAVLDVDGDGDMDIVDALVGDDTFALLINDGAGVFADPTYFPAGCHRPWGLATADMNDDGIVDLVAGCVQDERAAVSLGNGDGTFTAAASQDAGGTPWQVAVGDVDGDGKVDAALANAFTNDQGGALLRGNGDGTLDAPVFVSMPGHTPASDLGDLDGDGDLDWILSSFGGGVWRIYVNDGNGNFSFGQDIPAPSNPSCAVMLDFDNDGDIDLALSDEIADVVTLAQNASGPSPICPPAPATCRTTVLAGKSSFTLKDKTPDKGDQVVWKWAGQITAKSDYGNPVTTDDYALCLYDAGNLVASATADAGGTCGTKPCWAEKPTSFAYKDKDATPTGTQSISLKEGLVAGKAKIIFRGKGGPLVMPAPGSFSGPIAVRLHRSGAATCWGADFSAPFLKQDAAQLKDKSD